MNGLIKNTSESKYPSGKKISIIRRLNRRGCTAWKGRPSVADLVVFPPRHAAAPATLKGWNGAIRFVTQGLLATSCDCASEDGASDDDWVEARFELGTKATMIICEM